MIVVGVFTSLLLMAGGLLILLRGDTRRDQRMRLMGFVLLAFAGYAMLVSLMGEVGWPVALAGLIAGAGGLLLGLIAQPPGSEPARATDRDQPQAIHTAEGARSPLHSDPVMQRLGRATNAVLWDWELEENKVNYGANIIEMLGYDEASLRSDLDWWTERIHPDDHERTVRTLLEAVKKPDASWEAEYRFRRGDGDYANILDRGFVIAGRDGKPIRMVGAMEDITPQRTAEQAAQRSEAQFAILADNATDFIARLDRNLRHMYVNQSLVNATGIPRSQFIGRTNRDLGIERGLSERLDAAVRGVIETAEPTTIEFEYETPDGRRHLMCRLTPEYSSDGSVESVLSIVRDITELKQAADQLLHEKDFIETAINSLPGIFYLIDQHGRFRRWNDNFVTISQYTDEEIAQMHPTDFFRGEDKALIEQRIAEVFRTNESWAEAEFHSKDGSHRPFYFTGRHVILNDEPHLVGMGIDISDQKRAETELRASEERYRLLFDSNPHPMWVYDLQTLEFMAVNNAAVEKYGYSREEFLSMTIKDIRPEEDVPALLESIDTIKEGVDYAGLWRHRLKDGTIIDVEITSHKIEFDGRPADHVLANDVTERLRAVQALRYSEERFANFMDRNPAAAWIKDEQGRYVYVNQTLCEAYRVTVEDVLGKTDFELLRQDVAEQLTANDHATLDSDQPIETTETISSPDGTDHIWLIVKFPMRDPSGGRLVGGLALDVTDQKRAEQALRDYAVALERSNQELEQFAYVASHDLQEPLRMVASYTQLLAQRYRGKLDQDADEFIHFAVDGAERMQRLIDDLLLYSRVGTRDTVPNEVSVDEVLDEATDNLATVIRESEAEIERGELPTVHADRSQLVQLFQNLISNAIKFRGTNRPRITIYAEAAPDGTEWIFSISDTGIGIDPKYHERIFVIFQRLHGRAEYAGTGIGLALCKRIVERHGGRIWVESAVGEGATFRFTLPCQSEVTSR
jgi:PAS domain S-box-containing protein